MFPIIRHPLTPCQSSLLYSESTLRAESLSLEGHILDYSSFKLRGHAFKIRSSPTNQCLQQHLTGREFRAQCLHNLGAIFKILQFARHARRNKSILCLYSFTLNSNMIASKYGPKWVRNMAFATPRKFTVKDALCQSIDSVCLVYFSDVSRVQAKRVRRCINSNAVDTDQTRLLLSSVDKDLHDLFPSFTSKPIHMCSSCHKRLSRLQTAVKNKNDLELTIEKETDSLKHSIATFKKEFMAWKRCRSTKHPTSTSSTPTKSK